MIQIWNIPAFSAMLAIAACAGSPAATNASNVSQLSFESLCYNIGHEKLGWEKGFNNTKLREVYYPELKRRLNSEQYAQDIITGVVRIGMPETVAVCSWNASLVNETIGYGSHTKQYKAAGEYDYFFVENKRVTYISG